MKSTKKDLFFLPLGVIFDLLSTWHETFNPQTNAMWSLNHEYPTPQCTRTSCYRTPEVSASEVCLPRRDCSVPSSVDAISLSLSKPRPRSIHDWAVFSNTYNLHCIWNKSVRTTDVSFTASCYVSCLNAETPPLTCKTLLSDSSPVLTSTFSKMHFLAVALV